MVKASSTPGTDSPLRALPSVHELLADDAVRAGLGRLRLDVATDLARETVDAERQRVLATGGAPDRQAIVNSLLAAAATLLQPSQRAVINATGVILQTNLGRAPVSTATAEAMRLAATQPTTLEYNLASGRRGARAPGVRRLLQRLTGADDALVVNNNAGAVLLMLAALTAGRETIVSRGEAVEIGGGFRVPDVMRQSGASLVEVGTTNRTYLSDYQAAITPATGALLKVHPSNFKTIGFVEEVAIGPLASLARERNLWILHDVGSGALLDARPFGLAAEPTLAESVTAGVSVATASGDKLLGGPQAGILVGTRAAIDLCRRHPLARALRADKTCLAGLEATLHHYLAGEAVTEIPVWRMIALSPAVIRDRARAWQASLAAAGHPEAQVLRDESAVGGGALPGATLPTWTLCLPLAEASGGQEATLQRLRTAARPLIGRMVDGWLRLDPRTVDPSDDKDIPGLLVAALSALQSDPPTATKRT